MKITKNNKKLLDSIDVSKKYEPIAIDSKWGWAEEVLVDHVS